MIASARRSRWFHRPPSSWVFRQLRRLRGRLLFDESVFLRSPWPTRDTGNPQVYVGDAAPLFLARLDRLDHRLQAQASDAAQSSSTESQTNGPTATLLAKAPNATQTTDYIVKEGDNLWRIGRRFKVDSNLLARNNKLIPTAILRPGQVLVIAQRGNQPQTVRQVNYEVQPGDSLFNISRTFQIAIRDILQWNDLRTHNLLVPGQQLKLFLRL